MHWISKLCCQDRHNYMKHRNMVFQGMTDAEFKNHETWKKLRVTGIELCLLQIELVPTPFDQHFKEIIQQAPLDTQGEPNGYHCSTFIPRLQKYFLPQAALWSGLLLGKAASTPICIYALISGFFQFSVFQLWNLCACIAGDLGRHGTGPVYENLSKKYQRAAQNSSQVNISVKM